MVFWFMFFMIFFIMGFMNFSLVNHYTWCLCMTPLTLAMMVTRFIYLFSICYFVAYKLVGHI